MYPDKYSNRAYTRYKQDIFHILYILSAYIICIGLVLVLKQLYSGVPKNI